MSAQDAKDELAAGPGESTTSGYITPEDFERAFDIIYRDVAASDLEDLNDIVGLVGDTVFDIQNAADLMKKKPLGGDPAPIRPPSLDEDADTSRPGQSYPRNIGRRFRDPSKNIHSKLFYYRSGDKA